MKVEYFKRYSKCLNRDMEFKVYGHSGNPILVFPAQDGRFYDFENFKMVNSIKHLIDDGKIQLFCCDSIDNAEPCCSFLRACHRRLDTFCPLVYPM
jgi:esterase/lipase superfamily enzyme